ncbi:hypothetical protein F5H01DRAFT_342552 [Linnemannia elongata]|nr:hypothetical protein F5H01DRAFT_342552 [Linnemannia elongata]
MYKPLFLVILGLFAAVTGAQSCVYDCEECPSNTECYPEPGPCRAKGYPTDMIFSCLPNERRVEDDSLSQRGRRGNGPRRQNPFLEQQNCLPKDYTCGGDPRTCCSGRCNWTCY